MNYEEKYKQALERASKLRVQNPFDTVGQMIEHIFPELKEPEDDSIRNGIIALLKFGLEDNSAIAPGFNVTKEQALAWIEKQGKQKPADKVEPEFHEGDWVVYDHRLYQVVELPKEGYINLGLRRNGKVEFAPSPYCRHWAIQDAKAGDVLVIQKTNVAYETIFIFNKIENNRIIQYLHYFTTDADEEVCEARSIDGFLGFVGTTVHPATKEQRDLLFQKMKETGYEWDSEKKELRKVESKTLDADKVIEWLEEHVPTKFEDMANYVQQFKEDFGL